MSLHKLDNTIVRRLSTGQIISSVFSVVKELMENALDAGSTSVDIRLTNFGLDKISITDNGCGISSENLSDVAKRHYTSKISTASDIDQLRSHGFRGEALAAICACCDRVTLTTLHRQTASGNTAGRQVTFGRDGHVLTSSTVAHAPGTTVIVESLFSNLPVRRKYNSGTRVRRDCLRAVERLLTATAISRPEISLSLTHNQLTVIRKVPCKTVKEAAIQLLKYDQASKLTELTSQTESIKLKMLLPSVGVCQNQPARSNSTDNSFTVINNRVVTHKTIEKAVQNAYTNVSDASVGSVRPSAVILSVPPACIDPNLEPNKTRLYLTNEAEVIDLISKAVRSFYSKQVSQSAETRLATPQNNSSAASSVSSGSSVSMSTETGVIPNELCAVADSVGNKVAYVRSVNDQCYSVRSSSESDKTQHSNTNQRHNSLSEYVNGKKISPENSCKRQTYFAENQLKESSSKIQTTEKHVDSRLKSAKTDECHATTPSLSSLLSRAVAVSQAKSLTDLTNVRDFNSPKTLVNTLTDSSDIKTPSPSSANSMLRGFSELADTAKDEFNRLSSISGNKGTREKTILDSYQVTSADQNQCCQPVTGSAVVSSGQLGGANTVVTNSDIPKVDYISDTFVQNGTAYTSSCKQQSTEQASIPNKIDDASVPKENIGGSDVVKDRRSAADDELEAIRGLLDDMVDVDATDFEAAEFNESTDGTSFTEETKISVKKINSSEWSRGRLTSSSGSLIQPTSILAAGSCYTPTISSNNNNNNNERDVSEISIQRPAHISHKADSVSSADISAAETKTTDTPRVVSPLSSGNPRHVVPGNTESPITAFGVYCRRMRNKYTVSDSSDVRPSIGQLSRLLADGWNRLSRKERLEYEESARQMSPAYRQSKLSSDTSLKPTVNRNRSPGVTGCLTDSTPAAKRLRCNTPAPNMLQSAVTPQTTPARQFMFKRATIDPASQNIEATPKITRYFRANKSFRLVAPLSPDADIWAVLCNNTTLFSVSVRRLHETAIYNRLIEELNLPHHPLSSPQPLYHVHDVSDSPLRRIRLTTAVIHDRRVHACGFRLSCTESTSTDSSDAEIHGADVSVLAVPRFLYDRADSAAVWRADLSCLLTAISRRAESALSDVRPPAVTAWIKSEAVRVAERDSAKLSGADFVQTIIENRTLDWNGCCCHGNKLSVHLCDIAAI